ALELGTVVVDDLRRLVASDPQAVAGPGGQPDIVHVGGGQERLRRGDADDRGAELVGKRLGRRQTHPQPGEGPRTRADDDPGEIAEPEAGAADQPLDRRHQLLRVPIAALEHIRGEERAVGPARRHDDRVGRGVEGEEPCGSSGHGAAPAARAAATYRPPTAPWPSSRSVRGSSAPPSMRTSNRSWCRESPRRSGHSTSTTPADCRSSSRPPSTASRPSASRYRSMWNSGSRPMYSPISTKLGELIVSRTPRPAPKPLAKTVLPAPSSPHRHTTSPGWATVARRAAISRVASGLSLTSS